MLVVSRKQEESIIIGNEIEIVVVRIDRHTVRLGIKAPKHISVHRKEVYEEIRQENLAAAQTQSPAPEALSRLLNAAMRKKAGTGGEDPQK